MRALAKVDSRFLSRKNVADVVRKIRDFAKESEVDTIVVAAHSRDGRVGIMATDRINPIRAVGLLSFASNFYLSGGEGWTEQDPPEGEAG